MNQTTESAKTPILTKCMILLTVAILVFGVLIAVGVIPFFSTRLVIELEDAQKTYDGTPLYVTGCEIVTGSLPEGATVYLEPTDSLTLAGKAKGHADVYIFSADGKDITSRFDLEVIPADLTVTQRTIIIKTESMEKVYDGTEAVCEGWSITQGSLATGERVEPLPFSCRATDVGEYSNFPVFCIRTQDGAYVTSCYSVITVAGKLTIYPLEVHVHTFGSSKAYDGTPLVCPLWECTDEIPKGLSLSVEVTGQQTEPGESRNWCLVRLLTDSGKNVKEENYTCSVTPDWLVVYEPEGGDGFGDHGGSFIGAGDGTGDGGDGGGGGGNSPESIYVLSDHSGTICLRDLWYSEYDGHRIRKSKSFGKADALANPLEFAGLSLEFAGMETATAQILPVGNDLLVPYAVCEGMDEYVRDDRNQVLDDAYMMRYAMVENLTEIPDVAIPSFLHAEEKAYAERIRSYYLQIPDLTRDALCEYVTANSPIRQETGQAPGGERMLASQLLSFVRNNCRVAHEYDLVGDYSYTVDDMVVHCLTEEHMGSEIHVASTATMLFRAFGIPARLVHGYMGQTVAGEWNVIGWPRYWVEIYLSGTGWVMVDPVVELEPSDGDIDADLWIYTEKSRVLHLRQQVFNEYDGHEFRSLAWEYGGVALVAPLSLSASLTASVYPEFKVGIRCDLPMVLLPEYPLGLDANPSDVLLVSNSFEYWHDSVAFDLMKNDLPTDVRVSEEWKLTESEYRNFVKDYYLSVPATTEETLKSIGDAAGFQALRNDPVELIRAIVKFVQESGVYSMDMVFDPSLDYAPASEDSVVEFLTVRKYGVCRHFAAAATLMLRTYGIPARYTVGFLAESKGDEWSEVDTSKQGHAWVEAYIDGFGWVTVDPTPGVAGNGAGEGGEGGEDGEGGEGGEGEGGSGGHGGSQELSPLPAVRLHTEAMSKTYDGTPDVMPEVFVELLDDFDGEITIEEIVPLEKQLDVGVYPNEVTCHVVFTKDGKKGSADLEAVGGTLTIEPRRLFLRTESAEKEYDGETLFAASYEIVDGTLAPGDYICAGFDSPGITSGIWENVGEFWVMSQDGRDVTANYCLDVEYGTLRIY